MSHANSVGGNMNFDLIKKVSSMQDPRKGEIRMDDYLTCYIDNNIIREYAEKSLKNYHLQVCDLPINEQFNLLQVMFEHDENVEELILDRMQDLINNRIDEVRQKDNYNKDLKPIFDSTSNECEWIPNRRNSI